eukprot:GHRQ01034602.1.p1 GENE.GHRQ01034602.1~~GHRQ01034602.1.p1  ORF type:complete len:333 (-),score=69.93 GHRQ01034602.1:74-985(-)
MQALVFCERQSHTLATRLPCKTTLRFIDEALVQTIAVLVAFTPRRDTSYISSSAAAMMLHKRLRQHFGSCRLESAREVALVVRCSSSCSSSSSAKSSSAAADRRGVLTQLAGAAGCLVGLQGVVANTAAAEELTVAQAAAGGFIDWWKSRRTANGGFKLLAPLYAAQQRLQQASDVLGAEAVGSGELLAALQLVRASSLNCYLFEALPDDTFETKASLLTQKYELSGEQSAQEISTRLGRSLHPAAMSKSARRAAGQAKGRCLGACACQLCNQLNDVLWTTRPFAVPGNKQTGRLHGIWAYCK